MDYGKYPFEPYGYQGGFYGKKNRSLAAALGGLFGVAVGGTALLLYRVIACSVKFSANLLNRIWKAMAAGFRDGIRSHHLSSY